MALDPGKPEGTPVPAPVYQGPVPSPAPHLEDQVQDEVRQLLQQEKGPIPAPGNTPTQAKEPRQRLGW